MSTTLRRGEVTLQDIEETEQRMNDRFKRSIVFSKALAVIESSLTANHLNCALNYINLAEKFLPEEDIYSLTSIRRERIISLGVSNVTGY